MYNSANMAVAKADTQAKGQACEEFGDSNEKVFLAAPILSKRRRIRRLDHGMHKLCLANAVEC